MSSPEGPMRSGTIALSWGANGGVYVCRTRLCLWRVAITYVPRVELDDMMRAWVERADAREGIV